MPVCAYRGYTIWLGHPASMAMWCATGTDGTVWFEAEDHQAVRMVIDRALDDE